MLWILWLDLLLINIYYLKEKHFNIHLQNAWDKYGSDNFLFEILEECDKECLKDKEEYYIQTLKSNDRE